MHKIFIDNIRAIENIEGYSTVHEIFPARNRQEFWTSQLDNTKENEIQTTIGPTTKPGISEYANQ